MLHPCAILGISTGLHTHVLVPQTIKLELCAVGQGCPLRCPRMRWEGVAPRHVPRL